MRYLKFQSSLGLLLQLVVKLMVQTGGYNGSQIAG